MRTVYVDFNDRNEDGTYPAIGLRSTFHVGERVHASDQESVCAVMDVMTVSELANPRDYEHILLHLEPLEWHRPSCRELEKQILGTNIT